MKGIMEISVVVPVYNESDNIPILETEIRKVLTTSGLSWECIWVDDASQDSSWQEIKKLSFPNRGVSLKNQSGQTTATMAGIDFSKYEPTSVGNSLHVIREEYSIDGIIYRVLTPIGSDTPLIQKLEE